MVPIAPFVVVNLVMGALRIRLRDFLIGSLVGVMPGMLTATVLTDQVRASGRSCRDKRLGYRDRADRARHR